MRYFSHVCQHALCILLRVCEQKQGYSDVHNATNTPRERRFIVCLTSEAFHCCRIFLHLRSQLQDYTIFRRSQSVQNPLQTGCVCHHTNTVNNTTSHSHTLVFHIGFWKGGPMLANEWPSSLQVWPFLSQGGRRSKAKSWGTDPTRKDEGQPHFLPH